MLLGILECICLFELVFFFSLDICPGVNLVFWGPYILFSIVAASIYITTNSVLGFPFLHILANICYLWSFWWQPFRQVGGDIPLWFWFTFLWWLVMLSIFSCACWPSVCLLYKNVYSGLLPIFKSGCLYFLDIELYELFIYFGY